MVFRKLGLRFPTASAPYPVEMMALSALQIEKNTCLVASMSHNDELEEPCAQVSHR